MGLLQRAGERGCGWGDDGGDAPSLDGFLRGTGELLSPFPSADLGETPAGDVLFSLAPSLLSVSSFLLSLSGRDRPALLCSEPLLLPSVSV